MKDSSSIDIVEISKNIAKEKGISPEEVIDSMEFAIAKAGRTKYGLEQDIRAKIDRNNGKIGLFRYLEVVENIDEAISHIKKYGTGHTEAIITENVNSAEYFFKHVDSSIILLNASTQFADGGEFGFGAEIGISTGRMHARGPIGLEQLTTFKYIVYGNGQIRP